MPSTSTAVTDTSPALDATTSICVLARPVPVGHLGCLHRGRRDPARVDGHHLVRAVLEQAGPVVRRDRVAQPRTPAESTAGDATG